MYLIKQQSGFNASGYTNFKPENEDVLEVDNETYNNLLNKKLMWQNGSLVSNPNYANIQRKLEEKKEKSNLVKQVNELKRKLASTDYQAIKYAEGLLTESEYAHVKSQRQEWRKQINELEKKL